jgi:hypothetical protein
LSTNIHDLQPTLGAVATPEIAPTATEAPAAGTYEPPCLTPAGNLLELLGKSGGLPDYRNRRFHEMRP